MYRVADAILIHRDPTEDTMSASAKRPILVVDDEPDILHSLKALLRREYEVYTAGSGLEAMKVLQEHVIHLVMTDQRMPQMTGVDVLKRVKCEHPEAIRLIFTGYADIQAVVDAVNKGNVFRYVAKPWDPDVLMTVLHEAGEVYDRLSERERLLADLQAHEQRCMQFDDQMRSGQTGDVDPATAAKLATLFGEGRKLLGRLGSALAPPKAAARQAASQ
jgi:response regulator RpfG family c-di-GMP phosphodiesterase